MRKRFNEEIIGRQVDESCLRLVRALAVETHEIWMEANRYSDMDDLKERKKLIAKATASPVAGLPDFSRNGSN